MALKKVMKARPMKAVASKKKKIAPQAVKKMTKQVQKIVKVKEFGTTALEKSRWKAVLNCPPDRWTKKEEAIFRPLDTPTKISNYVDALDYEAPPDDYMSVRWTIHNRKAHCMGGAMVAAFLLDRIGLGPPMVMGFDAEGDDTHAIAVYKLNGLWGAIGKSNFHYIDPTKPEQKTLEDPSNFIGSRAPVYRTIRELMMSYYDFYFSAKGELSFTAYSGPFNMNRVKNTWKFAPADVGFDLDKFDNLPTIRVVPRHLLKNGFFKVGNHVWEAARLITNLPPLPKKPKLVHGKVPVSWRKD